MARAEETPSFRPIAANVGYCPGRSTTQRPLKRASSHTSHRSLVTATEEARSLKPKRSKLGTRLSEVKARP